MPITVDEPYVPCNYYYTHVDATNASVYSVAATSVIASGVYDFADFTLSDVAAFSFAAFVENSPRGAGGHQRVIVEFKGNVPASALTIPWAMQMLYSQDAGSTWIIASGSLSNAGLTTRCVGIIQPYPPYVANPLIKLRALALGTGTVTIELAGEFSVKVSV